MSFLESRRRVALHVGLLALNVLGLTALFGWREMAAFYHATRIRWDSAAFDELLGSAYGSPAWEALERYAREPEGRERVLGAYVSEGTESLHNGPLHIRDLCSGISVNFWLMFWCHDRRFCVETWTTYKLRSFGGRLESSELGDRVSRRFERLQLLMGSSPFERVSHPEWPGLTFTVFPRAMDPPGTEYWFSHQSWSWPGCRMLVATREGTPFPQMIKTSENGYEIVNR